MSSGQDLLNSCYKEKKPCDDKQRRNKYLDECLKESAEKVIKASKNAICECKWQMSHSDKQDECVDETRHIVIDQTEIQPLKPTTSQPWRTARERRPVDRNVFGVN